MQPTVVTNHQFLHPTWVPQAHIELPSACGVSVGTPLRIRGVQVGTVLNVQSDLHKVNVLVEVRRST